MLLRILFAPKEKGGVKMTRTTLWKNRIAIIRALETQPVWYKVKGLVLNGKRMRVELIVEGKRKAG